MIEWSDWLGNRRSLSPFFSLDWRVCVYLSRLDDLFVSSSSLLMNMSDLSTAVWFAARCSWKNEIFWSTWLRTIGLMALLRRNIWHQILLQRLWLWKESNRNQISNRWYLMPRLCSTSYLLVYHKLWIWNLSIPRICPNLWFLKSEHAVLAL